MVRTIVTSLFQTNTYIYKIASGRFVVIDPGSEAKKLFSILQKENGILEAIICTHGHLDHIGGVGELKRLAMENQNEVVQIAASTLDGSYYGEAALEFHKEIFRPFGLGESLFDVEPIPSINIDLNSIENYLGFKVIKTAGHTPGSISLYDEKNGILFSGDTLFAFGEGRTDLQGGDFHALQKSILTLLELPPNTVLYPGHGEPSTIQRVCKNYNL